MTLRTFFVFSLTLLFLGACAANNPNKADRTPVKAEVVDVYINGDFRGTTPGTIRVHRGRKELDVQLRKGRAMVRAFSIEEHYSQNTAELIYGINGSRPDGSLTFNVEELPSRDKVKFVIPFFEERLTIEDNQYGLTIVVVD